MSQIFCHHSSMRHLTASICLTLAILLFSATEGFALPSCPTDRHVSTWTDCFATYTSANGDTYFGEFRNGTRNGQGTYTHADGDKYVGEFRNGTSNGQGTYTFGPSSQFAGDKYVGEFRNGIRNGQGTFTFSNGDTYVGEFRGGIRNGQGTYTSADGRITEGIFQDGKFQYAQKVHVPVVR